MGRLALKLTFRLGTAPLRGGQSRYIRNVPAESAGFPDPESLETVTHRPSI